MSHELLDNKEIYEFIVKGPGSYYISKEARIARKVMVELAKSGYADFLLLRDEEVAEWWNKIYGGVQTRYDNYVAKMKAYEVKLTAYNKLTKEQRRALGIRKPVKPKDFT
jgi:hypothetical protein